jgi:outer membrane protein OmpA-like peptidoglycan-associated protein
MQRIAAAVGAMAAILMVSPDALAVDLDQGDRAVERRLAAPPSKAPSGPVTMAAVLADPGMRQEAPSVDIPDIRFTHNSELLSPKEIGKLAHVGKAIKSITSKRPGEVFLVEGHTDGEGSAAYNLGLSGRRAAAVAEALMAGWDIPAGSLFTVGYGEQFMLVPSQKSNGKNRRVTVRRITGLLHAQK